MHTPWGSASHTRKLQEGIYIVSTPSHGGMMIHDKIATKVLTKQAIERGERHGDYYCYEEDCDIGIPLFELKHLWRKLYRSKTDDEVNEVLLKTLSLWNPDYLLSVNVKPIEKYYQQYLVRKKEEEMVKNKDPDLIVAAWGSWETNVDGVIKVATADGKHHYVTEESYNKRKGLNLLSNCELVAM